MVVRVRDYPVHEPRNFNTMISFENWLATEQGGFFQHEFDKKHQLTESELRKIWFIFQKRKGKTPRAIMIKEDWSLQNEDGSLGIPGLRELGL